MSICAKRGEMAQPILIKAVLLQPAKTATMCMASMPICAKKERNGPASADQRLPTANQDSLMYTVSRPHLC